MLVTYPSPTAPKKQNPVFSLRNIPTPASHPMKKSRYELDPRGDVLLILQSPDRQHFLWLDQPAAKSQTAQNFDRWIIPERHRSDTIINAKRSLKMAKKKKRKSASTIAKIEEAQPSMSNPWNLGSLATGHIPRPEPEPEPAPVFGDTSAEADINIEPETTAESVEEPIEEPGTLHEQADVLLASKVSLGYDEEDDEMRMRASSRHLSLASPVFSAMLDGPWKESIPDSQSSRRIVTSEWDTEAFLILLDIIHGHHRDVPRSVSLEMLGNISVLVDYYNCHEVTEIFVDIWIQDLEKSLPTSYGKASTIWLSISWVFSKASIFEKMTEVTIHGCLGPVNTMNLPIPARILSESSLFSHFTSLSNSI